MTFLTSSASVEIQSDERLSPKDLHFLRQRLQEAFNEIVPDILEDFGVVTDNSRAVHIEEITIEDDDTHSVDQP